MYVNFKIQGWFIGLALMVAGLSASFTVKPTYLVHGTIVGLPATDKIYLSYEYNNVTFTDSTEIKSGSFDFKGTVPEPLIAHLKFHLQDARMISFFIENAEISIHADINRLDQAGIQGSVTQDVMRAFIKVTDDIQQHINHYGKKVDSIYANNGSKPGKCVDSLVGIARHQLMAYDFDARKAFVSQNAGSVFCAYMINTWYVNREYELDKASQLFALLTNEVKASYYGKQAQSVLKNQTKSAIGASPDFIIKNTNGVPIRLSSYKGKYVLVDFWASWCMPCRKQNPGLVAAYAKYHSKGLEILGVSLDKDKNAWLKAIKDDGLLWTQLSDLKGFESELAVDYGIKVIPSNFLLDKQGKVIAKNVMDEELNDKLKLILSNK